MTDKELVQRTQRRIKVLKDKGLENDISRTLENTIDVIWGEGHKKSYKISDIDDVVTRRIARHALNQFLKNPMSTPTGIKREYKKAIYNDAKVPAEVTAKTMVETIQAHGRYIELSKSRQKYGYDVESKARKLVNERLGKDAEEHRKVSEIMLDLSKREGFSQMTSQQKYNQLLREMRKQGVFARWQEERKSGR